MSDKSLNIETRPVKAAMSKEQMEQFVKENMTIVPKNQRNKFELLTLEQKVSKIHVYMDIKKVRELLFEKNKLENKVKELLIRRKATTEDDYFTFMKRDLLERADKLDSKIDRYRANDYAERISRFLDATGMRDTNPKDVLGKIKDAITGKEVTGENQKYAKAVADFLLPTDRKRQANLDDNFVDFVAKDISDRYNAATNNIKKKIKEKLTSKRALKFGKRFVKRGAKKIASMIGEYLQ